MPKQAVRTIGGILTQGPAGTLGTGEGIKFVLGPTNKETGALIKLPTPRKRPSEEETGGKIEKRPLTEGL